MATGNVDYGAVLADLEARKSQLEATIAGIKAIIASGGGVVTNGHAEGVFRPDEIPTHAFLGLSIADATKKLLSMVKSKQSLPQIMQSLERGGLPPAKYNTVYAVLRRRENQVGDIFRMGEDWALTEWYPNNPNIRKRAKQKTEPAPKPAQKEPENGGAVKKKRVRAPGGVTLADAAAKLLTDAGSALHIGEIRTGLQAIGRDVSESVVRDVLTRKDTQKRFVALGKGMFDLAERAPQADAT
jgi:hypothetical protein